MTQDIEHEVARHAPRSADVEREFTTARQDAVLRDVLAQVRAEAGPADTSAASAANVVALQRRPGRAARWLAAAAAVTAVGVGAGMLWPDTAPTGTTQAGAGAAATSAIDTSAPQSGATTGGTGARATSSATGNSGATGTSGATGAGGTAGSGTAAVNAGAAASLAQLALRAKALPALAPTASQFLHVVTVEQQAASPARTLDAYVAPDGWTWRKDTQQGVAPFYFVFDAKEHLDPATLPTDPTALEAALSKRSLGTASPTQGLFKELGEIALTRTAPADVRAASIELLGQLAQRPVVASKDKEGATTRPDVITETGTLDGRAVLKAGFRDLARPGTDFTYWFDATTSELVQTEGPGPDFSSAVTVQEVVAALPADIVRVVGTDRHHEEVTVGAP